MKRTLRLCGDRVVVERVDLESRIILPEVHHSAELDRREGVIVSVGSGKVYKKSGRRIPLHDLKPGQRVVFSKWAGSEMRIHGKDVIVMQMKDILAIVEQDGDYRKERYLTSTATTRAEYDRQNRALAKSMRRSA